MSKTSFKLGKKPVRIDSRTLKLKTLLDVITLPTLPGSFDVDLNELGVSIPEQMFGNDKWGDCVIAARANQTLRFEQYQQHKIVPVTTQICLEEYWREEAEEGDKSSRARVNVFSNKDSSSHPDDGLVLLDSLNEWRQQGWKLGDDHTYTIYAYGALSLQNQQELKDAVYLLSGAMIGLQLPQSAMDQFNAGQTWDVVSDSPIVGGHCVYIVGYNQSGPVCVTWDKKQPMTWAFYAKYCDEAYGVVMNRDAFVRNDPANPNLLDNYLNQICGNSSA